LFPDSSFGVERSRNGRVPIWGRWGFQDFEFAFAVFATHSFGMSDKQLILEAIQQMPEQASMDEILNELRLVATVRERLEKNPQGRGVPAEELLSQVQSWVTN
jgi:hypothetical protein